jgi:hypothetical protein
MDNLFTTHPGHRHIYYTGITREYHNTFGFQKANKTYVNKFSADNQGFAPWPAYLGISGMGRSTDNPT